LANVVAALVVWVDEAAADVVLVVLAALVAVEATVALIVVVVLLAGAVEAAGCPAEQAVSATINTAEAKDANFLFIYLSFDTHPNKDR